MISRNFASCIHPNKLEAIASQEGMTREVTLRPVHAGSRSQRSFVEVASHGHAILLLDVDVGSAMANPTTESRDAFSHDPSPIETGLVFCHDPFLHSGSQISLL